jgi:hypothetical protein
VSAFGVKGEQFILIRIFGGVTIVWI